MAEVGFHLEAGVWTGWQAMGSLEAFILTSLALSGEGGRCTASGSLLSALELPGSCFASGAANG